MKEETLAKYFRAATVIEKVYDIDVTETENDIIPLEEGHRGSRIEHCCHELAHALLLRLTLSGDLPNRIADALTQRDRSAGYPETRLPSDTNEIKTFAVEIRAMELLGFECDVEVFADACCVQVRDEKPDVLLMISAYQKTKECARLAEQIVREFNKRA